MAKRRTRKEKIIARLRHQLKAKSSKLKKLPLQVRMASRNGDNQSNKAKQSISGENIFGYDPALINKDLRKTAFFSVIFTIIILGFFLWQKNNWWLPNFKL